jgi:hypothetical protein
MARLVFHTPLSYGVPDVETVELDLGVIAHLKSGVATQAVLGKVGSVER